MASPADGALSHVLPLPVRPLITHMSVAYLGFHREGGIFRPKKRIWSLVAAILSLNGAKNNPKIVTKITAVRPKGGPSHKGPLLNTPLTHVHTHTHTHTLLQHRLSCDCKEISECIHDCCPPHKQNLVDVTDGSSDNLLWQMDAFSVLLMASSTSVIIITSLLLLVS